MSMRKPYRVQNPDEIQDVTVDIADNKATGGYIKESRFARKDGLAMTEQRSQKVWGEERKRQRFLARSMERDVPRSGHEIGVKGGAEGLGLHPAE
jgi:hypothetical protein